MISSMIFFPTRDFPYQPKDFNLPAEDARMVTSDGVMLHGWYTAGGSECLLFFHGNAGNISLRLPRAKAWHDRGFSVLLVDYRSYGKSGGKFKHGDDLHRDAEAALKWLKDEKKFSNDRIIIYGESLGSVPAAWLAAKGKFNSLILEAPFTSAKDVAKIHYAGLVPDYFLKDFPLDNAALIGSLKTPVMIVHGTADETIPFWMGKRLFEASPEPKEMYEIEGGGHSDMPEVVGSKFFDRQVEFVRKN